MRTRLGPALVALVMGLTGATAASAQSGTVTGTVKNRVTGQALSGVQIYLVGTTVGQISNAEGRFLIPNVAAGRHTVAAQLLGYAEGSQNVTVTAGQTTTIDFVLAETVLALEEMRVTGTADPIAGVKAPFSIGKITRENVATVPTINSAAASIQGKVAGASIIRGSGQPGSGVSVLLRSPTTVFSVARRYAQWRVGAMNAYCWSATAGSGACSAGWPCPLWPG